MLTWTLSQSSEVDKHDDYEADLSPLGNPGGGSWISVALDLGDTKWAWNVYDKWLYDDADVLAGGWEPTEEAAKAAAEKWVNSQIINPDRT